MLRLLICNTSRLVLSDRIFISIIVVLLAKLLILFAGLFRVENTHCENLIKMVVLSSSQKQFISRRHENGASVVVMWGLSQETETFVLILESCK